MATKTVLDCELWSRVLARAALPLQVEYHQMLGLSPLDRLADAALYCLCEEKDAAEPGELTLNDLAELSVRLAFPASVWAGVLARQGVPMPDPDPVPAFLAPFRPAR